MLTNARHFRLSCTADIFVLPDQQLTYFTTTCVMFECPQVLLKTRTVTRPTTITRRSSETRTDGNAKNSPEVRALDRRQNALTEKLSGRYSRTRRDQGAPHRTVELPLKQVPPSPCARALFLGSATLRPANGVSFRWLRPPMRMCCLTPPPSGMHRLRMMLSVVYRQRHSPTRPGEWSGRRARTRR